MNHLAPDMNGIVRATESILRQKPEARDQFSNTLGLLEIMRSIGKSNFYRGYNLINSTRYSELPEEDRWLYLAYSCIIFYCLGRLDDAERCMKTALALDCVKNVEPAKATALYLLSTVLALQNKTDRLLPHLAELLVIGEKYGFIYHLAGAKRLAALEKYLALDTGAAVELLDDAVSLYYSFDNRAMAAATKLLRRLWTVQPGGGAADLDRAREDVADIQQLQAGMMLYEISLSVLGAIAGEAGDYSLAENCLLASIKTARRKKSHQVLCGSCFHLARLYFACSETEQGHR